MCIQVWRRDRKLPFGNTRVIVMKRIFKDIKLLGRHITLGQQEGFSPSAFSQTSATITTWPGLPAFRKISPIRISFISAGRIPLHRQGAGIGEGNVEIIFKGLIGVIV